MRAERTSAVLVSVIVLSCVPVRTVHADLVSHWTFDGHLEDDVANNDGTFHGANDPVFVEDREGNPEAAISLNGFDELVQVDQATSLPLYQHATFSVSMWVRGGVQNDKRVWAESTTRNRAGLYNLGTQNRGVDGRFDLYVRGDNGAAAAPRRTRRCGASSSTSTRSTPAGPTWSSRRPPRGS